MTKIRTMSFVFHFAEVYFGAAPSCRWLRPSLSLKGFSLWGLDVNVVVRNQIIFLLMMTSLFHILPNGTVKG